MGLVSTDVLWHYWWHLLVSHPWAGLFTMPLLLLLFAESRPWAVQCPFFHLLCAWAMFCPSSHPASGCSLMSLPYASPRLLSKICPHFYTNTHFSCSFHGMSPGSALAISVQSYFQLLLFAVSFSFQLLHWSLFQYVFHVAVCPEWN